MRLIIDRHKKLGKKLTSTDVVPYKTDLKKEEISREFILNREGRNLNFLDVGGRDGSLNYLLGIKSNLDFDDKFYEKNKQIFLKKYKYFGLDLNPDPTNEQVIYGDICSPQFIENWNLYTDSFDIIYSNNVMEHISNPFQAAANLTKLCKINGLIIMIVPFSQRFHAVPTDFFRYTHTAFNNIFSQYGRFDEILTGYDIQGRRNDWQGTGQCLDLVPEDSFGAWRETWFTVTILKKIS